MTNKAKTIKELEARIKELTEEKEEYEDTLDDEFFIHRDYLEGLDEQLECYKTELNQLKQL